MRKKTKRGLPEKGLLKRMLLENLYEKMDITYSQKNSFYLDWDKPVT